MPFVNRTLLLLLLLAGPSGRCLAFNPPRDEAKGFIAVIHAPTKVAVTGGVFPATLELINGTGHSVTASCEALGVDGWKVVFPSKGVSQREIPLRPLEKFSAPLQVEPATDSFSALYPLHVTAKIQAGTEEVFLHAIAILEVVGLPKRPSEQKETGRVVPRTPFQLMKIPEARVEVIPDNGPVSVLPAGWTGMDPESGTSVSFEPLVARTPQAAPAIAVHPPWRKGPGKARLIWHLVLPSEVPITLSTAFSMRDTLPSEPPSDGVTFRVHVNGQVLFEKHSNSKAWDPAQVDLSAFAGNEIALALESDVGPKRDATCDLSYWRQPWILAGAPVPKEEGEDASRGARLEQAQAALLKALASDKSAEGSVGEGVRIFQTGMGESKSGLAIIPGPHGILDAAWAVGAPGAVVGFDGFHLELAGASPMNPLSGCVLEEETWEGNSCRVRLRKEGKPHWITLDCQVLGEGFELKWNSDLAITGLAASRFGTTAAEILAGAGNVIVGARTPFTLESDGHRLATRHVGLRFENGLSLVLACSNPPDRLVVDWERGEYSLHTHLPGSFYLVPSIDSPFDAAIKYREIIGLKPGPGVKNLSGRFTFDLWGGRYKETAEALEKSAKYGLTHSVAVFHSWQRWGYDYRLPDIYPPNPKCGSLEDFKRLSDVCRDQGMLFAPHDNYIDIYPDSTGFSYDLVCFSAAESPIKGWFNAGRKAQAYCFRPDKFLPFLERNLKLIRDNIAPDAYFVDVFSSIRAFDYETREGEFHDMNEARDCWNTAFDRIREILGGNAPQISESGTDWLIGHLDGAQANHIRVGKGDSGFTWNIDCADSERIPWEDAVTHKVFVLQGAGYPSRYAGGQDLHDHGTHSDDYLSDEILTGHAPMADHGFSRAVVRKYWLLHDFLAEIAGEAISRVEFEDGNIHRQKVAYANGAQVWVNRGESAWELPDGHLLLQYGFWAKGPMTSSGVFERNGRTVEEASSPQTLYADGRGLDCQTLKVNEGPPTDFGWCRTNAGIRMAREPAGVKITPLPSNPPTTLEVRLGSLGLSPKTKVQGERFGGSTTEVQAEADGDFFKWETDPIFFAYRLITE